MQTSTTLPRSDAALPARRLRLNWPRGLVVLLAALAIFVPLLLIFYQSFLSAPFFAPVKELTLDSYRFIFDDPDFRQAFINGFTLAAGLTVIAVPLGGMLAFLMVRTDLPGRSWIAPALMVPIFVSPMVIGFGYVVSMGPVGFYTVWFKSLLAAIGIEGDDFAVDQRGRKVERLDRLDQRTELVGPVLARAGVDGDILPRGGDQRAVSVELDLVHPRIPGRDRVDQRGKLRRPELGRLRAPLDRLRPGLGRPGIMAGRRLHLSRKGLATLSLE